MNNDKLTFCLKCDPKLLKHLQEAYDIIENDRKKRLKKFVDIYAKPLSIRTNGLLMTKNRNENLRVYAESMPFGEDPPKWPICYAGFDSWEDLENALGDFNLTPEERQAYEAHKKKCP